MFLRRDYPHWSEALILCNSVPEGILAVRKLQLTVEVYFYVSHIIRLLVFY